MTSGRFEKLKGIGRRLTYYGRGFGRDLVPRPWFTARRETLLATADDDDRADAAYLSKAGPAVDVSDGTRLSDLSPWKRSRYYYDAVEYLKYFPKDDRILYVFGDVTRVPDRPTIVKSRPIDGDNANSVVLNLNKLRHFDLVDDPIPFEAKRPSAVWRGILNNPKRIAAVRRWGAHPVFDIGHVRLDLPGVTPKPRLDRFEQLAHRYVVSIEGNDVATNLKWIMASNSLCLMPRPRYETWLMEGRLVAGVHYAEVADDFSDLDAVIDHYESHPDEARAVVAAAQAYIRRFVDRQRERRVSLLVLDRYFRRTGQA